MKHAKISNAWRPVGTPEYKKRGLDGALSAFVFNLCLLVLPLAAAAALLLIARDHLYAYEYSNEGARAVALRVAKLNGELIQIDIDRQSQWESLIDLELRSGDHDAARGFLLSGAGILARRPAEVLRQADATDAELEMAALQLLTPSTRARYLEAGPLLSQVDARAELPAVVIGAERDFEMLARAMLNEPEADPLQFILTGYGLGLAGDLSPSMTRGAAVLLDASRREYYPEPLAAEINALLASSVDMAAFREAARDGGRNAEAGGAYAISSEAFRSAVSGERASQVRALLDQLGAISDATSRAGAAALLTHASSLRDMPRLTLLARAAGDRVVAAAKRLPRDGRLVDAARGQLTMTQDLLAALIVAAMALFGLVAIVVMKAVQAVIGAWRRFRAEDDEDYYYPGGELVEISTSNWRPL